MRIASGLEDKPDVEVAGVLLGRGRFDAMPSWFQHDESDFGARVRLDDGSVLTVPMSALVRRG